MQKLNKRKIIKISVIIIFLIIFMIEIPNPNQKNIIFRNKTAIFFGDSVAYGYSTGGKGYGFFCDEIADFKSYTNAAVNTATINTKTQQSNNISNQIEKHKNEYYDYVILQGGYGDLRDVPPLGRITESFNANDFDMNTFSGGIEYTLFLAKKYYPNSKIGFIISYNVPKSNYGIRSNYNRTKQYWDVVKEACRKWQIPYLDFFEGKAFYNGIIQGYSDIFEVYTTKYLESDYIHPNIDGYNIICSFIVEWMKEI